MEQQLLVIAIWITLAVGALAVLALVLFGARNLASGKLRPMALVSVAIPAVLAVVLYFVYQDWVKAAIVTTLIMAVLAVGALLLSGVRGVAS